MPPSAAFDEPAGDTFERLAADLPGMISEGVLGRVSAVGGLAVRAEGLPLPVGARCTVFPAARGRDGRRPAALQAEVVGRRGGETLLSVFGEEKGIAPGDRVEALPGSVGAGGTIAVGPDLLGRIVDAQGRAIDGGSQPVVNLHYPLYRDGPAPLERRAIRQPMGLGIRSIDALLTAGRGQRLGIFAGSGVGKSVLLGMLTRFTAADVTVVALVGERGREVRDFVENQIGPQRMRRTVVVACTSDQAPALRVRGAFAATAVAEYFRDRGADVLLVMDSLTRVAMAQRQIGLAAGEPPTARGYPPSAFALLPRLLERAGRTRRGSITGLYTVLVEGDDIDEPLSDAVRGVLDGHIWLSRHLANRGQYPAVDVLRSVSRVAPDVTDRRQQEAALAVRAVLATWEDIEDLVSVGAYVPGADREYDVAVRMRESIFAFLRQGRDEACTFEQAVQALHELAAEIEQARAAVSREGGSAAAHRTDRNAARGR